MKKIIVLVAIVLFPSVCFAETKTVDHVDLNRYLGDWYEIASIPQSFAKGCHCTRARYGLEGETITVLNSCNKGAVEGELSLANGKAKVVDKKSNAKLKVSFFWPFYGDYWIIGLDKEYKYAVVSNRDGTTLWILSRTPVLEVRYLDDALKIAKANSIDTNKLAFMEQKGCVYPN